MANGGLPDEQTILNVVRFLIFGKIDLDDPDPLPVRLSDDRALAIWSQMVGRNAKGERVVQLDPSDLLRTRPYEPIHPVTGALAPGSLTTVYTSTSAQSSVIIDVVNTDDDPDATVHLVRNVDGSTGNFEDS